MKNIIAIISSFLIAGAAYADACGKSLTGVFTSFQATKLCSTFGSSTNHSMIPSATNTYDLGSSSLKWKDLYISGVIYPTASIAFTNTSGTGAIFQNTSDGSDTGLLAISGGGSFDAAGSRGSGVRFVGNEGVSNPSSLTLYTGSVDGDGLLLRINNASDSVVVQDSTGTSQATIAGASGNFATNGTITSAITSSIGWSVQSAANQACNTTCTSGCVVGQNAGASNVLVGCADATADVCLCAGAS